jgi:Flp pilus assembly protein TadD
LPTEHTIRNDYGYVLMQAGQNEPALHEFLTAVELAPDYRQAAHNLVLLLYKQGDMVKAEAFARQFGLVEDEMQQLKKMTQASNKATP